jgi:hypothetical protein
MTTLARFRNPLLAAAAAMLLLQPSPHRAEAASTASKGVTTQSEAAHDGQRDFDFLIGTWKVHLRKLTNPLTGSTTWVEFHGKTVVRRILDGRANMDEVWAEDPVTRNQITGATLRLFDPGTKEWYLYWTNGKSGKLGVPTVGKFKNGRGEFYDQEEFQGKTIFVRYVWFDIRPDSAKFEQAFSTDGGKSWETNWITTLTRESQ